MEDAFIKRSAPTFELSILSGIDSFTYMVSDGQQNILALREYELSEETGKDLKNVLQTDRLVQLSYRNVRMIWSHPLAALIPTRLFNPADRQSLLGHLAEVPSNFLLKNDNIPQLSATNIYGVGEAHLNNLKQKFPGGRLFHLHSALYWGCRMLTSQQGGRQVFVHVRGDGFRALVFEGANLLLVNYYTYQSAKDFLYFILLLFEQFKLDQETTPLSMSGKILTDSEIYRLLSRYIRKLQVLQPPAFFKFGPKLSQKPKYFYFDLFCGLLCK